MKEDVRLLIEIAFKEVHETCKRLSKENEELKDKVKDLETLNFAMDKKFDEVIEQINLLKASKQREVENETGFYNSYKNGEV